MLHDRETRRVDKDHLRSDVVFRYAYGAERIDVFRRQDGSEHTRSENTKMFSAARRYVSVKPQCRVEFG